MRLRALKYRFLPVVLFALPGNGLAQEAPVPVFPLAQAEAPASSLRSPVVTLDRDRLYDDSEAGKSARAAFDAESAALIAENRRLESALEAEERQLTEQRASLPADQFRKLADEFDAKVEDLRSAQDAKSRALTQRNEADRQAFFEKAIPVLGQLMVEIGAVAIIDRSAIILTFDQVDITDLAIQRLDEAVAAGAPAMTDQDAAPGENTGAQQQQKPAGSAP